METLRTLPGDDVRQLMWRFADRFDLQMLVQSSRSVARTSVARMVADGQRKTHDWTPEKEQMFQAFDAAGITSVFMDPEQGGYIEGPKNLALALAAFELAWVDAGAATASLAGFLALSPIHERGTEEQRNYYLRQCVPGQNECGPAWRGAFALTEPLPYVGVDTGVLAGKVRVAEWKEGGEPMLQVDKRGRFITNMQFADFVTAAVDTDDERICSSCMVIVHKDDPGSFDPGSPTLKLVHQLSATNDPVINVTVPASRIVGGYTIKDGVIVPNYNHSEIIAAVFSHTRVTVGLMSSAKLLSAIEPVIRYQRGRFRGGSAAQPGSPRYDYGLQQKQDALQRLIEVWAVGEAGASMGFETARLFDLLDPLEKEKDQLLAAEGIAGVKGQLKFFRAKSKEAVHAIETGENMDELMVRYMIVSSEANVLCPAVKLWNTGTAATYMREALCLMGGYGITEDCPGFLPYKWMDTQLESIYEGPEAVQRRQLSATMVDPVFLALLKGWIQELAGLGEKKPGLGACVLAAGLRLWLWTLEHLQKSKDPDGRKLYHPKRHGATFPMADALCWLLGPRYLMLDVLELEEKGPMNPAVAEGLEGFMTFYSDLCHVQAARAAGEASRICAELVYGYAPVPDCGGTCCQSEGAPPPFGGVAEFGKLRAAVECAMAGSRLSKDRAGEALLSVMIPETQDYPI